MSLCSVQECQKKAVVMGLCRSHRHQLQRYGDPRGGKWRKDGSSAHPLKQTWQAMMKRCYNPKHCKYHLYGGRGIKVCERWHDFWAFVAEMPPKPAPDLTLERIDNDKGYEPNNVKWATITEQNNNRRMVRVKGRDGQ